MAYLPMYLSQDDLSLLLEKLNSSSDVGFIVRTSPGNLAVVPELPELRDGRYQLWHFRGEALPLYREKRSIFGTKLIEEKVTEPRKGWKEVHVGANGQPWFGGAFPDMYMLEIRTQARKDPCAIGLSGFEWAGNSGWSQGRRASGCVTAWWEDLRKWAGKTARKIPRSGDVHGPNKEVYAFPNAFRSIVAGTPRADNPGV